MSAAPDAYRGKRLVDLVLLAVVIVPAGLVGAVCAAAVALTSRGPVFFRQVRIGARGRPFRMIKFRTMIDARKGNPVFPDTDRITAVGRVLRRFSLDELPQLVNVARGEMSIVGPRPPLGYQAERYSDRQSRRMVVRPGLTGLAQVETRNAAPWAERIEFDLDYLNRQSPWLDAKIVARTLGTVVRGTGVHGHPLDDPLAVSDDSPA